MGESQHLLAPAFNRSVRVEARDTDLSGDSGAVLLRDILERTGVLDGLVAGLHDPRDERYVVHDLKSLISTAVVMIAQGWRSGQDADRLRDDLAMRIAGSAARGSQAADRPLPSQPTLSRLLDILTRPSNLKALSEAVMGIAGARLRAARQGHRQRYLTIDIDGLPLEVHGHQPGAMWNGHYGGRIYDPLIASAAETGDMLDARLRPGNAGSAQDAVTFIREVVARAERELCQVALIRFDAGFPSEELLSALEADGTPYVARLKSNKALDRLGAPYKKRPRGRPPKEPRQWCQDLSYQAGTWSQARRVIMVVKERPDDLVLDHYYLVTSIAAEHMAAAEVLAHYRERGTAEGFMGELKSVLDPALSSTLRPKTTYQDRPVVRAVDAGSNAAAFSRNAALLKLNLLAYELLHTARTALEAERKEGISLRRLRRLILVTGTRVVRRSRRLTLVIERRFADVWAQVCRRLNRWCWAPP